MPSEVNRDLNALIDSIPDVIYSYVDRGENVELDKEVDGLMKDFSALLRPYVKNVMVDKDCKVVRYVYEVEKE